MTEIKLQILTVMESKGLLFPNSPIGLRTGYAVEDAGLRYGFNVADDGQLFEANLIELVVYYATTFYSK